MNKSISLLTILGLTLSLQAGTIQCNLPVCKVEPVFKTVIKKIPQQTCWDEVQTSPIQFANSTSTCEASGIIIAKKCTVTKCKTTYKEYEEQVLVGYKNYAKCDGKMISKVSNCKLKTITINATY
jgi:hypothetical protein